jgi:hypothetical protein
MQRNGMHATMDELARDTGGRAFYNSNGLSSAMDTAVTNGAHFYSLAYTPPNAKMDGSFRRIQVKVAGGYKVSYRRGYYAEDEKETKAARKGGPDDPLQPFMGFAMPNFEQIVYKVRVEPAKQPLQPGIAGRNPRLKGPTIRYAIDFAVVLKDVHLDVGADGIRHGTVNLSLRVYDRYGEALNWQSKTIGMEIKPDAYPKFLEKGLQLHDEIDVPKGMPAWLRTGIYDPATSLVGTLEIPLDAVRDVPAEAAK